MTGIEFGFSRAVPQVLNVRTPDLRHCLAAPGPEENATALIGIAFARVRKDPVQEFDMEQRGAAAGIDERGRPLREEDSTTYTSALEDAAAFGRRIWNEAWRRGWSRARKKVILGDGAAWIWNLAHQYFPTAIEIVNLYHARKHLWKVAAKLYPSDEKRRRGWARRRRKKLDAGRIEQLVATLREIETDDVELTH